MWTEIRHAHILMNSSFYIFVLWQAQERSNLRLSCSALNAAVMSTTTKLRWAGSSKEAAQFDSLPLRLFLRCPFVLELDLTGLKKSPMSLEGCPKTMKVLRCWGTSTDQTNKKKGELAAVPPLDLWPLTGCPGIEELHLGYQRRRLSHISPLSVILTLRVLNICHSSVSDLSPLSSCHQLRCAKV